MAAAARVSRWSTTSTTKSCPSRRSSASTPWCPRATQAGTHRDPVGRALTAAPAPRRRAAWTAATTRTASALARDLVHPDRPGAGGRGQRGRGRGRAVPGLRPGARPRRRPRPASSLAEEALARRADQQRAAEPEQRVEVREQGPVVLGASWRSRGPGRARAGRGSTPGGRERVEAGGQLVARPRPRRRRSCARRSIRSLAPRQCITTYGTCGVARRARPSPGRPGRR